jgi:hypothetical protein
MRSKVRREISRNIRRLGWSGVLVAGCVAAALFLSGEPGPTMTLMVMALAFLGVSYLIAWLIDRLGSRR